VLSVPPEPPPFPLLQRNGELEEKTEKTEKTDKTEKTEKVKRRNMGNRVKKEK
jgi:hypothetical protein